MALVPNLDTLRQHRVVLIHGPEAFLRHQLLAEVCGVGNEEAYDRVSLFADETGPASWLAQAGTPPFWEERRTVVVRKLHRGPPPGKTDLESLPETAFLVLVSEDDPDEEQRTRRGGDPTSAWTTAVKAAGGLVVHCAIDRQNPVPLLREAAREQGKKLAPVTAQALFEVTGGSLSRSLAELEKLVLYVGDAPEIMQADVLACVTPSPEWSIFHLLDALFAGRCGEALSQVRILLDSTKRADEAAYKNVFPMLSRQLRLVWQGRVLIENDCTPHACRKEVRALLPSKPNLLNERDFVQRKLMVQAQQVTREQLARCFSYLAEADAKLKGLLPGYSPFETLEELVLRCHDALSAPRRAHARA